MMNIWNVLHLVIFIWPNHAAGTSFFENGCVNYYDLPGTKYCYKITEEMDGISAWEHCTSLDFREGGVLKAFKTVLKDPESGKIPNVWIGYRESYRKSLEFIGHDTLQTKTPSTLLGPEELCLYLNSDKEDSIDWQSCETLLPMVCAQMKWRVEAFNASHPDDCGENEAIAVSSLPGCFAPRAECTDYSLEINFDYPTFYPKLGRIKNYLAPGSALGKSDMTKDIYCHLPPTNSSVRLELRRNKTANGFSVWVQSPSRIVNTPICPDGDMLNVVIFRGFTIQDPYRIYTYRKIEPDTEQTKYIWCFAQDKITGKYFASNRLSMEERNVSCRDALDSPKGPPVGTTVDTVSSCLRCLKLALTSCVDDSCSTPCEDIGCGPFKLTKRHWSMLNSSSDDFKNCSQNHRCAAGIVEKLGQRAGDCNRDGFINCDDVFDALTYSCNSERKSEGPSPDIERERYWNCRKGNESEFVDLLDGNRTVRYYCQQFFHGKLWSDPLYFSGWTSYVRLNTTPTVKPEKVLGNSSESTVSEDETLRTLKILKEVDSPLTEEETAVLMKKISNITNVRKDHLKDAQTKANVSSMPQLIEHAMLYVPDGINISTRHVSLSKTSSLGVFVSEQLSNATGRELENVLQQYPVKTTQEIFQKEEQIEAGIVLSGLEMDPDTKFVIMVFAEDTDIFPDASDEGDGELGDDGVRGEINSKVVAATLTRQNTTVPLTGDAFVDIIVRARRPVGVGQQKCCAYSDPKSGGSSWRTDGCELVSSNVTSGLDVCRCNHLTHFAQLLTEAPLLTGDDAQHLRRFTIAACLVSLLSQCGLLVTGALYKTWRKKPENQVLLNMAAANTFFMALLLWQCFTPQLPVKRCSAKFLPVPSCWWTGVALHYIVLANFSWMLVCAVTHVLRIYKAPQGGPKVVPHFLLIATTAGWSVPIMPVGLVLAIDDTGYTFVPSVREFCYPSGKSFYLGVLMPVAIMFALNAVAYILILKFIFPKFFGVKPTQNISLRQVSGGKNRNLRSIVIVLAFMFLFGLTWILGLTGYNLVSMYSQCLAVFFQGPTLFCIFVLGERNIRSEIRKKFTSKKKSDKAKMLRNSGSGSSKEASSNRSNDSSENYSTIGKKSRQKQSSQDTPM